MCGRYALFRWSPAFAALPGFPPGQQAQWNISPGQRVLIQRLGQGGDELALARWGLTPPWLTDLSRTPAQARAETLADQPMFREPFRQRRCLMPANGFYEWRGSVRKQPYWLTPGEGSNLHFAALWEAFPVGDETWLSVAVVTQAAMNQRRPLILEQAEQAQWLAADTQLPVLQGLLARPCPQLRERPLARLVNDPQLNAPECLTPA
ncbi:MULTISPECIES: SOS response-associated peptidase [unclassified Pseudomonas]|uniref:SOS response-associated peptidase n=1 Tax=unclassified Pseudomonas TaxID=196821 RepID=UPI000BD1992F|nr:MULTISPECIES: SOS response-associated peptidase [unclassified Pseudomonas]PVZ15963.1 putative SOS response-associated peptidase YedK [Pseudomonas sp. URIL14HWK12:I12]PVZ26181.1 putative SOS response-associated peptidase YedK [Pseudomonas sp. URIL14HWK12:I10]PVZ36295.1 putative SOS response-associated peptidase YedK [Pseudomonas sp. URIL14HWK12:I11]SNZ18343.1 Putative SOS response-associated peptidase YedK [Pseudomonas sp. URIL14HWK12:I9]